MATHQGPIPDLILEQYALGELAAERMLEIDQMLESDSGLAARLESLRASDEEILRTYPPEHFVSSVARRIRPKPVIVLDAGHRRTAFRRWLVAAPVLSMAAVAVCFLILSGDDSMQVPGVPSQQEVTRIKGLTQCLKIYRQHDEEAELLTPEVMVERGDVLQISYIAADRPYGVIVSVDGRGAVTLHYPVDPGSSTRLDQSGETAVPFAYEIDDAPEFERFFFITGQDPVPVDHVMHAAQSLARDDGSARTLPLDLPDLDQNSILVLKKEVRQ